MHVGQEFKLLGAQKRVGDYEASRQVAVMGGLLSDIMGKSSLDQIKLKGRNV